MPEESPLFRAVQLRNVKESHGIGGRVNAMTESVVTG